MKPGYKQTEIGVIPEDWSATSLGTLLSRPPRYGINAAAFPYNSRLPLYLRITDITDDGRYCQQGRVSVNHPSANNYFLEDGDVVVARTGASVGKSYHHHACEDVLVFAGFLICISADRSRLAPAYLEGWLKTESYWGWVRENSMRSGQPGLNGQQLAKMPIPLPPTLAEQEAIAGALSDADALIDSLEQLIAKKRLLKQGAMQDLLTGKNRLPGFEGVWEEATFSSKLRHHSGDSTLIKGKLSSTPIGGYYPGFSASGQDVWLPSYAQEGDALVVSAVGSRCGKCFRASGKWSAIANTHIVWPNAGVVSIAYLMLYIHDEEFWTKGGSGQPFVKFKESFEKVIAWPSLPEQTAIAAILSDMDAEIAALEAKLAKARQVKQGMMQELLTGKTRLV